MTSKRPLNPASLVMAGMLVLGAIADAFGQPAQYVGRTVAEVLQQLQTADLRIIFSSDLVPETLRVKTEPKGHEPRQIARQILEPHGLTLQQGPRNTWLVVALPKPTAAPGARTQPAPLTGRADDEVQEPVPVAVDALRIEERVDVVDRLREPGDRATVYTIGAPEIRETAGAFENALHVLQLLPGVAATNDEDGKLAVRGAGPEHNLIVIDGVAIHSPQRFGDFISSFLNPSTAASVTLDPSGLSARQGGRLSSVTSIETRDGSRDRKLGVSGSLGLTSGDVLLEGRLPGTQSGTWWATARGTYYRLVFERFRRGETMPGFGDVQFKISANPSETTRLSVFGLAGRESMTQMDNGPRDDGGDDVLRQKFVGISRLGVMNLSWVPSARLITTTTFSAYAHDARDFDRLTDLPVSPYQRDTSVDDVAVRQRAVFALSGRHVLDAGIEAHRIGSSFRLIGVQMPEFPRGLGPTTWGEGLPDASVPVDARLRRTEFGAWLQDRIPLGSRWVAEPGVRLDWNSLTGESAWQPRLRLSGQLGRALVWAGASMQTQTPSHESLQGFDYFHLTDATVDGLRNERSRQMVAGIEHPLPARFGVRVEVYRRWFDRLLVQRLESDAERAARLANYLIPPDLPPDSVILEYRPTIYPESTGTGDASGLEVLLHRSVGRIGGSLSYTLSKSTRDLYGHTVPFDFDRRHALSAIINWDISDRVRFAGTWRFASGYPVTALHDEVLFGRALHLDGTIDPIARPSRQRDGTLYTSYNPTMRRLSLRNTERLSEYSRTDVRVTYATPQHWEFYGEVINLFNTRNYLLRIEIPPIDSVPGFTARNNVYTELERIPTFGIRFRF